MKKLFFTLLLLFCFTSVFATFIDEEPTGGPNIDQPPAPIDESVYVLLLAGIAYSGYYLYQIKTSKPN